jgi:hypothetical protein
MYTILEHPMAQMCVSGHTTHKVISYGYLNQQTKTLTICSWKQVAKSTYKLKPEKSGFNL